LDQAGGGGHALGLGLRQRLAEDLLAARPQVLVELRRVGHRLRRGVAADERVLEDVEERDAGVGEPRELEALLDGLVGGAAAVRRDQDALEHVGLLSSPPSYARGTGLPSLPAPLS